LEHILKPREEDVVRGFVPATALTAMHPDAASGQINPRLVKGFQTSFVELFSV
jgi:hypothetical protein